VPIKLKDIGSFRLDLPGRVSPYILVHWIGNIFRSAIDQKAQLRPYFATYYTTLRCNLACTFCGEFPNASYPELDTGQAKRLLEIIRADCPSIYFTGGEPTLRNDIVELCRFSKEIGFSPVSLNTNASLLHVRPDLPRQLDHLVVSLNTLDVDKFSLQSRSSADMARRIQRNIAKCSARQRECGFRLTINCVVTPETIADTPGVMDFCFDHGATFALAAKLVGHRPDRGLAGDPRWEALVDYVLARKDEGKPVSNTRVFLDHVRRFEPFDCNPTSVPHIYPMGEVLYPCQVLKGAAVGLLETGSYAEAVRRCREQYGPIPRCARQCHLACYMESSMATTNPMMYLRGGSGCA